MLNNDVFVPQTFNYHGTEITYFDSHDDHGTAEPLFLIHGTTGSTQGHFGFLFPILASRMRVISIDLADVDPSSPLTVEGLTEQAAALIDELKLGSAHVLGYSLGACVAADLAARHPQLVSNLLLVCGWIRTDLQQLLRNDVWAALRAAGELDALRKYTTFCAFGGPFLGSKSLAEMQPGMDAMTFDSFGDRQMELNRVVDLSDRIESISATTLVIGCTHDQMVPIRHQRAMFGAIEDSRFVEIPTGHAVVFERPSELTHQVLSFLNEPTRYPAGSVIPTASA